MVLLLLATADLWAPAAADGPNQAGLVIQFADDHVETRCTTFDEDEIAGNDLLARSGLDVVIDATSGLGITVCQIEGQGCSFPAEHCFCQCMGGEGCRYWNYFYRDSGDADWTYSPLGALLRKVQPGSVEAWVWGDGQAPPDDALTFAVICSPPTPAAPQVTATRAEALAATRTASATRPATVAATIAATALAPATAAPIAATTMTPAPTPASGTAASPTPADRGAPSSYLVFGLLVLALALIAAVAWLRRR